MALVALADDGNYLVATVWGEWTINPYNGTRAGRMLLIYIDNEGNTIWEKKIGPTRNNIWIKNLRKTNSGYIITGFSAETDSATYQYYSGWMMKLDNYLDSVWYRDYIHEDENWENYFYDAYPTSDNGYIAVGKAQPDLGNSKLWVVKVDSMGCDTPGCATGTFVKELPLPAGSAGELAIWPNPAREEFRIAPPVTPERGKSVRIVVYNSQGIRVKEIKPVYNNEPVTVNTRNWQKGIYYIRMSAGGRNLGSGKVVVE
jgi:hypothetical protein